MKKKLLILTQYFPPEVGAPQNRLSELAERLHKTSDIEVEVLTAMPNYPHMVIFPNYRSKLLVQDTWKGIKVIRSYIFVSTSKSIIFRLLNYFSFVISSFFAGVLRVKKVDYILCESPPLFLGISAYLLCKIKKAKFIFNISDLWPESAEKMNIVNNKLAISWTYKLELFLYKNASLITGQTQGIVNNIRNRTNHKNVYWLPNGVDISLYNPQLYDKKWRLEYGFLETDVIFLYAGIIGYAQGLEIILHAASIIRLKRPEAKFIFLGEGPEKIRLQAIKDDLKLDNVFFLSAVKKEQMPSVVSSIDVAIIPLRKLDLFKGAIPSKIFENLAMQKPILLGVDGEAKELFIEQAKAGVFFEPENIEDLVSKIEFILNDKSLISHYGINGRKYVSIEFNRDRIAKNFHDILIELE